MNRKKKNWYELYNEMKQGDSAGRYPHSPSLPQSNAQKTESEKDEWYSNIKNWALDDWKKALGEHFDFVANTYRNLPNTAENASIWDWILMNPQADSLNHLTDTSESRWDDTFGNAFKNPLYEHFANTEDENKWYQNWLEPGFLTREKLNPTSIVKSGAASALDVAQAAISGVVDSAESIIDTGAYGVSTIGGLFSKDFQENVDAFIAKDILQNENVGNALVTDFNTSLIRGLVRDANELEEYSVIGDKTEGLLQSGVQLAETYALNALGVPADVTQAVFAFGSEAESALQNGAGHWEAGGSAAISAAGAVLTEMIFKGSLLDDLMGNKGFIDLGTITSNIKNKVVKSLADYGIDAVAEGTEEVIDNFISSLGSLLYEAESPEEIIAVLKDKNSFNNIFTAFAGGFAMSGIGNTGKVINSVSTNTDYRTGLTAGEQSVFDKAFEQAMKDAEAETGKKPTGKEKAKLYGQTMEQLQKGYISTDTIGEVLDTETYTKYKDVSDQISQLQPEYDELYNMKTGEKTDAQIDRQKELKQQLDSLKQQRTELDGKLESLAKGTKLEESYKERTRRSQAFQAESAQYENEYARQTVQNIVDSGVVNNTNRTHELVDLLAKVSADRSIVFSATDAKKLKETGFAIGDATVNGYYTENGIAINVNSPRALNTVVGHEITHALEGSEFYDSLKDVAISFAKNKGDYNSRMAALVKMYTGKQGYETDFDAKMEKELVADLIGEYVFNDADFVRSLSAQDQKLFQKIYEEIKYLCKAATAGSKEARQLEKVKKIFAEAYRDTKNTAQEGGSVKYSLCQFEDGTRFVDVQMDAHTFDGMSVADMNRKAKAILMGKFAGKVIGIDNRAFVNGDSVNEYLHPSKAIDADIRKAKLTASGELDNLLDAGIPLPNEPDGKDGHIHPDAIDFSYYKTIFKVGTEYFEGIVNIKNIKRGQLLKDITKIRNITKDIVSSYGQNPKSNFLRDASIYSLSENDQNVNSKMSLSENAADTRADGKSIYGKDVALEETAADADGQTQFDEALPADDLVEDAFSYVRNTEEITFNERMELQGYLNKMDPHDLWLLKNRVDKYIEEVISKRIHAMDYKTYAQMQEVVKAKAYRLEQLQDVKDDIQHQIDTLALNPKTAAQKSGLAANSKFQVAEQADLPSAKQSQTATQTANDVPSDQRNQVQTPAAAVSDLPAADPGLVEADEQAQPGEALPADDPAANPVNREQLEEDVPTAAQNELTIERPKRALSPDGVLKTKISNLENEYKQNVLSQELSQKQFDEKIEELKDEYKRKRDKTKKAANNLKKQIQSLEKRKADVYAEWEEKINSVKKRLYRARVNYFNRYFNNQLSNNKIKVSEDVINKARIIAGEKTTYIKSRAEELRKEITGLKKGMHATEAAGYLLDYAEDNNWHPIITALLNIRDNPTETVNNNSSIESIAREMLNGEYEAKVFDWSNLLNPGPTPENAAETTKQIKKDISLVAEDLVKKLEERDTAESIYGRNLSYRETDYARLEDKNSDHAKEILAEIEVIKNNHTTQMENINASIKSLSYRIERMTSAKYATAKQRQFKDAEYAAWAATLLGDTSNWVDKKTGWGYMTNTLRRNLRDIVKDANGKPDHKKADAIYEALQGNYNHNEAERNRELTRLREKYANLEITEAEDAYIQMLGEYRSNPSTTLTEDVVNRFYKENKKYIDTQKVDKIIDMARRDYDNLILRVNDILRRQGLPEIPYRKGYFPHFREDLTKFEKILEKYLNWKTVHDEVPTDIAGMTEGFEPVRTYQAFDKQRTTDITDYSFTKGFDKYSFGALDWIYHIEDIQKRRAVEQYIRYIHSEVGIQARIDEINQNEQYNAEEAEIMRNAVYAEAKNPLNNFVIDLRRGTQTLAGKKSSLDRQIEYIFNRRFYNAMTNISNRVSANMVAGSISAGLTNWAAVTQSWAEVSPMRSLQAIPKIMKATIRNDNIAQSDFLTNRLQKADNLYKTWWDRQSDKVAIFMTVTDTLSAQIIWQSKYDANMSKGMSENESIKDADQFAANVMGSRSRGDMPTIFESKNPILKLMTAFQLEPANQFGYLFKDVPQNLEDQTKTKSEFYGKLAGRWLTVFVGAYVYNSLAKAMFGRTVSFDPLRIIQELVQDILSAADEEDEDNVELSDAAINFGVNILQEVPFIGGLLGGGRVPISSALPYGGIMEAYEGTLQDSENFTEGGWKKLTAEWLKPAAYILMPMGGGQLKKTIEGLGMYLGNKPVAGSYTTDGKLRYDLNDGFFRLPSGTQKLLDRFAPEAGEAINEIIDDVNEQPLWQGVENATNFTRSTLFGQWSSRNAQEYIDQGRKPLSQKQTEEFAELDIPIQQYWDIRDNLNRIDKSESKTKQADKVDFINSLDLTVEQKNILVNNILDRKENVDMTDYDKFGSFAEFDFSIKNPEKYAFLKQNNISYADYAHDKDAYNWAYENPGKYALSKAFLINYTQYNTYRKNIAAIESGKDQYGQTVSNSQRQRRIAYINSLPITKLEKAILIKQFYPSYTDADQMISMYINSSQVLSPTDKYIVLYELGLHTSWNGGSYQ